jgi:hypothetical protein
MSSVRLVADGMYADVGPRSKISNIRASIAKTRDMVASKSGAITPTMRDTPTVYGQYKTRMNKFVAPDVGLGLDGQTKAYIKPTPAEARAIFKSKYVPFSDQTELLTDASKKTMSQRGYGNIPKSTLDKITKVARIGFNNTLVDTSSGKITFSMAKPMAQPNNPVYSDFPKGPGVGGSAPMWEDGTYRDTINAIHKIQDAPIVQFPSMMKDPRKAIFDTQALVGEQVYGNELLKQTIADEFATERFDELRRSARIARPLATEAELNGLVESLEVARRQERIARQLKLPATSDVVRDAAFAEIRAEQIASDERAELAENQARLAQERHEYDVEQLRKQRVRGGLRGLFGRLPGAIRAQQAIRSGLEATRERREAIQATLRAKLENVSAKLEAGEIGEVEAGRLYRRAGGESNTAIKRLGQKVRERVPAGEAVVPGALARRPRGDRRRRDFGELAEEAAVAAARGENVGGGGARRGGAGGARADDE